MRAIAHITMCGVAVALLFILFFVLNVDGSGSGDWPSPVTGDWYINTTTDVYDEIVIVNGSIIINSNLSLQNVSILFNSTEYTTYGMYIYTGAYINGSILTVLNESKRFFIISEVGSNLVISNTNIKKIGVGKNVGDLGEYSGIYIKTNTAIIEYSTISDGHVGIFSSNSSPYISNNLIINNTVGIYVYNGKPAIYGNNITLNQYGLYLRKSNVTISYNKISETMHRNIWLWESNVVMYDLDIPSGVTVGVFMDKSSLTLYNSRVYADKWDFWLNNSFLSLINTTFRDYVVYMNDIYSRMEVSWFLSVEVLWYTGDGVDGALVNITNSSGFSIATGITNETGWLTSILLKEYIKGRYLIYNYNPYNVTASAAGLKGRANVSINRSMVVRVIIDNLPPLIEINWPEEGDVINTTLFDISGRAWDNESGIDSVFISRDNLTWTPVTGTTLWNYTLYLSDGAYTIWFMAYDKSSNSAMISINITIDTIPPALLITYPPYGFVSNNSLINITGTVEPKTNITLINTNTDESKSIENSTSIFNFTITLIEGKNFIRVYATDKGNNKKTVETLIILDTTVILRISPENGTYANTSNLTIYGETDIDAILNINEEYTEVRNGLFDKEIELTEGRNIINIYARDSSGNEIWAEHIIFLDSTPPSLNIFSPINGSYTNRSRVIVSGVVEIGADIYINSRKISTKDDGSFNISTFRIRSGENEFIFYAVDSLGNSVTMKIIVTLDTIPPYINLTSPKIGQKTRKSNIFVEGYTEPGASVYINGKGVDVSPSGKFRKSVSLDIGNNTIIILATDMAGNTIFIERTVLREKEYIKELKLIDIILFILLILLLIFICVFLVLLFIAYRRGYRGWEGVRYAGRIGKGYIYSLPSKLRRGGK